MKFCVFVSLAATVTDAVCAQAAASLTRDAGDGPDHVFVGGTSQVARAFDAIETVREVLGVLEQQYVVVTLLRDVLDRGLQVAIGTETGMAPLAECALIVAPYQADGEPAGTIGVLGPSRMDYPHAMAAVAVVSHRFNYEGTYAAGARNRLAALEWQDAIGTSLAVSGHASLQRWTNHSSYGVMDLQELERNDWLILSDSADRWTEPNDSAHAGDPELNRVVEELYCPVLDAGGFSLLRRCRET